MNITNSRASRMTVKQLVSCLVFFLGGAGSLSADPIGFRDSNAEKSPGRYDAEFAQRIEGAVDLLRRQAGRAPSCVAYFEKHGIDLGEWLAPGTPPTIISGRLDFFSRGNREPICGAAQNQPPFELLFVDKRCFRHLRACDLASLILHEFGHLARRDTHDHEPPDFFTACRLSTCVDPARFN